MEFGVECDLYGYSVVPPKLEFAIGCDIGQSRDFAAVAAIEKRWEPISVEQAAARGVLVRSLGEPLYLLRGLARFKLGTGYEAVLLALKNMRQTVPQFRDAPILVDVTGNRGIFDLAGRVGVRVTGIQITAGEADNWNGAFRNVGKTRLINLLQATSASGDLRLPPPGRSEGADLLRSELANFAMGFTPAGNLVFSNRDASTHDDTIIATALALLELKAEGRGVASQTFLV
jgi:hypothetical protein